MVTQLPLEEFEMGLVKDFVKMEDDIHIQVTRKIQAIVVDQQEETPLKRLESDSRLMESSIIAMVQNYDNIRKHFAHFHSKHEAYAHLKQSTDLLWETVKVDGSQEDFVQGCISIGSIAIAMLMECRK